MSGTEEERPDPAPQRPAWDLRSLPPHPAPPPPPPRFRMPVWGGVLVGVAIGAVLVVVTPVVLVVGLLLMRYVNVPPEPDGDPVSLPSHELTGAWQDDRGGILVLAADGGFSATRVCGDYTDFDTSSSSGFDFPSRISGKGTWDSDGTGADGATAVDLDFTATSDGGDVDGSYDLRAGGDGLLLWTYVGDPDSGETCVLEKTD
ncbi:hypothetical protein AB0467_29690 [Streptomyces sp. NPDC052095]|uniref:hypothetical protein n=1 Tax=unclassified Streptomyces TaxID=2593676 RepID=UPI00344BE881